eukprot:TRINITY_DN58773_c0_g1_i1.p1 TRINITY_DN58773_c0_g1~~TRINITY_DN58773_c0_g1_i1.p1  ORF type:complete len:227 (+),score=22.00 TRINITY_DN58773_c0_g1_i1:103-783(+)
MSDSEDADSRDSLDSLIERGRSYLAYVWDEEAYRLARWWDDSSAELNVGLGEPQSHRSARRHLYRRYATMQARARVASALKIPVVARHVLKQDFFSVRVLFEFGVSFGGSSFQLTPELALNILSFLGYREKAEELIPLRGECMHFFAMCPLFTHRMQRSFGSAHVARQFRKHASGHSTTSDEDEDSESVASESDDTSELDVRDEASSTGSVSASYEELTEYFRAQL